MAIKHIPDGGDFEFSREFGFTGSAPPRKRFATGGKVHGGNYADGGDVEGDDAMPPAMAEGGEHHHLHPHGHHVVHVEHHAEGGVTHYHAHGGFTHHHPDGHITHHDAAGSAVSGMPHMGVEGMHDESEYAHRKGGEIGGEMGLVHEAEHLAKRAKSHEKEEAHEEMGEGEREGKAFGGPMLRKPGMHGRRMGPPHGMNTMPPAPHTAPPMSPAGGAMPMGVQPSDEGGGGIPQMSKGGMHGRRR